MQAHSAGARLPARARIMTPQARNLLPGLARIVGPEQSCILHAGVKRVGGEERRFDMPDTLELPGVRRAVIPLVRSGQTIVGKMIVDHGPTPAAILRALHDLPEPAGALRGIEPVWMERRSFDVKNLPTGKMWTGNRPPVAAPIARENERTFSCADKQTDCGHVRRSFPAPLNDLICAGW